MEWPRTPFDITWFYTNRNGESDPNWDHEKSEVKGPGDITPPKIQITSRELSFWGVLVYIYLSQCRVFLKKFNHICTHCSLNPKLIRLTCELLCGAKSPGSLTPSLPLPHYSLFITSTFILVNATQIYIWEPDSRPHMEHIMSELAETSRIINRLTRCYR
jgi:hypothetical protein